MKKPVFAHEKRRNITQRMAVLCDQLLRRAMRRRGRRRPCGRRKGVVSKWPTTLGSGVGSVELAALQEQAFVVGQVWIRIRPATDRAMVPVRLTAAVQSMTRLCVGPRRMAGAQLMARRRGWPPPAPSPRGDYPLAGWGHLAGGRP